MANPGPVSQERLVNREANRAMTVRDVAEYLNVSEKSVYRLAQRRQLPGFKVAGAWRFHLRDIEDWIQAQKQNSANESARR